MVPLGHERHVLYSEIIGAISDFTFNLFLIPRYGVAGAAAGTTIAEALVIGYQYLILKQKKLTGNIAVLGNTLKVFIATISALVILFTIRKYVIVSILFDYIISAICYFGLYFIIACLLKEVFSRNILRIIKNILLNLFA